MLNVTQPQGGTKLMKHLSFIVGVYKQCMMTFMVIFDKGFVFFSDFLLVVYLYEDDWSMYVYYLNYK